MKAFFLRSFTVLLRLLPASLRERHSEEMLSLLRRECEVQSGGGAIHLLRLGLETLLGLVGLILQVQFETVQHDVRSGFRQMLRSPKTSIACTLILTLAIGAGTVIFSVADAVLLLPPPFPEPSQLLELWAERPVDPERRARFSEGEFLTLEERNRSFVSLAAFQDRRVFNVSLQGRAFSVAAARMTSNLLETLGVTPSLGRAFLPAEDRPGSEPVALVTYRFWSIRLGRDPAVLGRNIFIDGTPRTLVGVLPEDFSFPDFQTEVWVPLALDRADIGYQSGQYLSVIGRSGSRPARVTQDLLRVSSEISGEGLTRYPGTRIRVAPLSDQSRRPFRRPLHLLMAAAALVILLTSSNLAGLFLIRSLEKEADYSLRLALGASRGRLLRQLVTEHLLTCLLGGACGVLLGGALIGWLRVTQTEHLPGIEMAGLDARVLTVSLIAILACGFFAGLIPAWSASRKDPTQLLAEVGRGLTSSGRPWLRNGLVVGQIAISLLLLVASGLVGKTLLRLYRVDPGFQIEDILSLRVALSQERYRDGSQRQAYYRELLERLISVPEVKQAGAVSFLPLRGGDSRGYAWPEEVEPSPDILPPELEIRRISPGYFQTLGIGIRQGRDFNWSDASRGESLVVISRALAEALWPKENSLGRRFRLGRQVGASTPWRKVIGVVDDIREQGFRRAATRILYMPDPGSDMTIVLQTPRSPTALASLLHEIFREVDPEQSFFDLRAMREVAADSLLQERVISFITLSFAGLALLLSATGLYAVMDFMVQARNREFALRLALGAEPGRLRGMILRQSIRLGSIALIIGSLAAWTASGLLESLLYGVEPQDSGVWASSILCIVAVTLAGSWLPACRARQVRTTTLLH